MFRIILGILLAVGVFSMQSKINPALDSEWGLFKQTYKKVYSPSQEIVRRLIWEHNLGIIKKHNAEFEAGNSTFTLGVNAYADMTSREFGQQMNGYRMDLRKPAKNVFNPQNHVGDLPTTVDWREKGYVTPVKDQGPCGSCWAFSTTGSLEGQHFKKTGDLVSLSEQNLVDCSWSYGNQGCAGGLMELAMDYVVANDGVDTEPSYPYTALDDGPCLFNRASVGATAIRYDKIRSGSEKDLQIVVANVGPISVAIDALTDAFQFYKSGVLDDTVCSSVFLNHAVLAVGYGVYEGKDYWLVKNSWGTSWGIDGYIMMSRNNNNQCGIATDAGFPTV